MKLIASIAAGAGIIAASFVFGQKYQAAKIDAASAKAKAQAEFLSRTHKQEVFLLESQLQKEVESAKQKQKNLIDDIRNGKLRLRACVSENNSAAGGTNVAGDDRSSRQAAESAVRVGAECDELNVKFKALQDWAKSVIKQQEGREGSE